MATQGLKKIRLIDLTQHSLLCVWPISWNLPSTSLRIRKVECYCFRFDNPFVKCPPFYRLHSKCHNNDKEYLELKERVKFMRAFIYFYTEETTSSVSRDLCLHLK